MRQSRNEEHFQPEAENEVLKGFGLKLTPMGIAMPLQEIYLYQGFRELVLSNILSALLGFVPQMPLALSRETQTTQWLPNLRKIRFLALTQAYCCLV
ncbi:hypothetical protein [Nostoc sp.]|uniref:hypothetical protein n=1 Tax=Nostoc sp. TaxID=1180 RepID=UPI002FF7B2F9